MDSSSGRARLSSCTKGSTQNGKKFDPCWNHKDWSFLESLFLDLWNHKDWFLESLFLDLWNHKDRPL